MICLHLFKLLCLDFHNVCLILLPQSGFALGNSTGTPHTNSFPVWWHICWSLARQCFLNWHERFNLHAPVADCIDPACLYNVNALDWIGRLEQPSSLTHCTRCSSCCVLLSEAHSAEELERRERLRRKQQRQQEFQVLRAKIQDQKPFGDKGIS